MANKLLDKDRLNKCVDYILGTYSFEEYLRKYGLFNDDLLKEGKVEVGYNQIKIPCPFPPHVDYDPSLVVNTETNLYNCYGCEEGGNLITFISHYETKVLNHKIGYVNLVETFLKNDKRLRLSVGFDSVFIAQEVTIDTIQSLRARSSLSFRNKNKDPKNFIELSKIIMNEFKNNDNVINTAISLMQQGMEADDIYRFIKNAKILENNKIDSNNEINEGIDISEILGDSYDKD